MRARRWSGAGRLLLLAAAIGCSRQQSGPPAQKNASGAPGQKAIVAGQEAASTADAEPQAAPTSDTGSAALPGTGDAPAEAPRDTGDGQPVVRIDSYGRKWIGDVPLDVWFDDPLAVAGNPEPVTAEGGATESTAGSAGGTGSPAMPDAGDESDSAQSGRPAWNEVIPIDVLEAEVSAIQERLAANLRAVRDYNRANEDVRVDAATLAALAVIAGHHSEPVSWKPAAFQVGHLAGQIADSADAVGRQSYSATREAYTPLAELLAGRSTAAAEDAAAEVGFADCADRAGLMKRIERAHRWLKQNLRDDKTLRDMARPALTEATVLATLAAVIGDGGYVFADEDNYAEQARLLGEASRDVIRGVQEAAFDRTAEALDRGQKSCAACHQNYRF